jgi:hypothetical protein
LRIAIVSTPRSGNTWVRGVLRDALALHELAVHNYRELPPVLPEQFILQLHWYREPGFQAFLRDGGFKVIVLGRHPLDVLLSVLHFVRREPLTARWLEGNAEIPPNLSAEKPFSGGFERYATSWGAENLLSVSYQWWLDTSATHVRYEDLVRNPQAAFRRLISDLGGSCAKLDDALAAHSIEVLRATPNRHGWQGTPGLWRQLIPPVIARRIQRRHARVFHTLGYRVPLYVLTRRQAEQAWARLAS